MNLGWVHGAPNSITYWRCSRTQRQGLQYGRFSAETLRTYRAVACPCDETLEVTVYTKERTDG